MEVLETGLLAQGSQVEAFENEFGKSAVEDRICVAVNSGTSALHLSLLACGIGVGDEVIVPSFSFAATANAVALTGASPVFVDIEEDFFCIDPSAIRAAITPKTKAVIPVHLYGHPSNMVEITQLCMRNDLMLIEDAAQAHKAAFGGHLVGTFGQSGCFSFYPTKNMTSGEGGMVATSSESFARKLKLLRNQGQETRYRNEIVGFNNRMTDLHAAIGREQLKKLEGWTARRQENAAFFDENLSGVICPKVAPEATHVYHQYTIRVVGHDRDRFVSELALRGVGAGVYYPVPIHRLPSFELDRDLPCTERVAGEVVSIPVHPSLAPHELEVIVQAVNSLANAGS